MAIIAVIVMYINFLKRSSTILKSPVLTRSQYKSESKTDFLFPIDTARIRQICRAISLEIDIPFYHHQWH